MTNIEVPEDSDEAQRELLRACRRLDSPHLDLLIAAAEAGGVELDWTWCTDDMVMPIVKLGDERFGREVPLPGPDVDPIGWVRAHIADDAHVARN